MIKKELTKRDADYAEWYLDVIQAADLADYAPVKGCMVIKPTGYAIWESIQGILDRKFKDTGVENAYFPLLIPVSYFQKEAEHVEGFSPEFAVVTEAGGKKLEEPLVIRPTSETVIYEMFSRWISSYRDLPLVYNQWANIVRWEKRTRLFLRTSEFLWQEGHTAHRTVEEARDRAKQMQEVYRVFCEDYLAIPVIVGAKTASERFAGAEDTLTLEAMMQDGKALQMGTSHLLGANFTDAFNIKFLDEDGQGKNVRATSWGVSTRLIGGLIMTHSDDEGLVLPPKIAPLQAVIVPIYVSEDEKKQVTAKVNDIASDLKAKGIRVKVDDRDLRPGPKFFEWEKKGVPIRIEIGPKDIENDKAILVRRDTKEKLSASFADLTKTVSELLDKIQMDMYGRALSYQKDKTRDVVSYEDLKKQVETGFAGAYWCGGSECEAKISEETKATIRCVPYENPVKETGKCVLCGKESNTKVVFARSY